MIKRENIMEAILSAVDDYNDSRPKGGLLNKSPETHLYGREGNLDSLGLVGFIVAAEERIREKIGTSVTLADERALSQERSPFRTVNSLADYVLSLLEEEDE